MLEPPVKEAGHTHRLRMMLSTFDEALAMRKAFRQKVCEEHRTIRVYTRELHTRMVRMRGQLNAAVVRITKPYARHLRNEQTSSAVPLWL